MTRMSLKLGAAREEATAAHAQIWAAAAAHSAQRTAAAVAAEVEMGALRAALYRGASLREAMKIVCAKTWAATTAAMRAAPRVVLDGALTFITALLVLAAMESCTTALAVAARACFGATHPDAV